MCAVPGFRILGVFNDYVLSLFNGRSAWGGALGAAFWDRIQGAVLRLPRRGACAGRAEVVDFRTLEEG